MNQSLERIGYWLGWDWHEMVAWEVSQGQAPGDKRWYGEYMIAHYEPFEDLPDPRRLVGDGLSDEQRAKLVGYLKAGKASKSWKGYSYCRFGCGAKHSDMGTKDFTDGTYEWPEGLAHYVEKHQVMLPEKFVEKVLSS